MVERRITDNPGGEQKDVWLSICMKGNKEVYGATAHAEAVQCSTFPWKHGSALEMPGLFGTCPGDRTAELQFFGQPRNLVRNA